MKYSVYLLTLLILLIICFLLAICLKTYPDEDDMEKFVEGHIEAFEVRIYYKGEKYLVTKYFDEKYYKLLELQ